MRIPNVSTRNFLILVTALALAVRLIASFQTENVLSGSYGYLDYARNLLAGQGYHWDYTNNKETMIVKLITFRPPVYTLFYTALLWIGNMTPAVIIIVQAMLGTLVPILMYLTLKQVSSEFFARTGCLIASVYPHFITRPGNVSEDNLYIPLILLGVYASLRFTREAGSFRWIIVTSLSLGLAILTRQTIVSFIPLLFLFLLWHEKKNLAKLSLYFWLPLLVVLIPWIAFHYSHYGRLSISDSTGRTLWTGNNELTYDNQLYPTTSIDQIERKLWQSMPDSTIDMLKNLGTSEQDAYFMKRGMRYINEHPLQFIQSIYWKNLGLLGISYNPDPVKYSDETTLNRKQLDRRKKMEFKQSLRIWTHQLVYGPILILACAGMLIGFRRFREVGVFHCLIASFILISWVFWSHTRHAIAYHPIMIIFALLALEFLSDLRRAKLDRRT